MHINWIYRSLNLTYYKNIYEDTVYNMTFTRILRGFRISMKCFPFFSNSSVNPGKRCLAMCCRYKWGKKMNKHSRSNSIVVSNGETSLIWTIVYILMLIEHQISNRTNRIKTVYLAVPIFFLARAKNNLFHNLISIRVLWILDN